MTENNFKYSETLDLSRSKEIEQEMNSFLIPRTRFSFIDDHFSFRPKRIHTLLGPTGTGKTSMLRSVISNLSYETKIVWLASEELKDDLIYGFKCGANQKNIEILFESKLRKKPIDEALKIIEKTIDENSAQVFVLDNVSTSKLYNDCSPKQQSDFLLEIKDMMNRTNCAGVIVTHLQKNVMKQSGFESDKVRGNGTLANISEYFYNFHRLKVPSEIAGKQIQIAIVHVEKARSHTNDKCYQLFFDLEKRSYSNDKEISWGIVSDLFSQNITMTRSKK